MNASHVLPGRAVVVRRLRVAGPLGASCDDRAHGGGSAGGMGKDEQEMSDIRTGTTKAAWLFLLREGGRWTAVDIADELGDSNQEVMQMIAAMVSGGLVRRYEKQKPCAYLTYGVTAACKVPRGVTIAELAECGAVRLAAV